MEDRWVSLAVPLLERIGEREPATWTVAELGASLPATPKQVEHELVRLHDDGWIKGAIVRDGGGLPEETEILSASLTARGARAVGVWPSDDPYERLLALLDRRIEDEPDGEQRSRLQRLRGGLADVGKGTVAGVLTELMKGAVS